MLTITCAMVISDKVSWGMHTRRDLNSRVQFSHFLT
uniref:Uncharacterized protein n=1 Tax=Arundo donax TaxID=35708 RepID=A0A0A8YME8_ARUDO